MNRFRTSARLAEALKPQLVDGKWRKPKVSARYANRLRKEAIVAGRYGTFVEGEGGWDWRWDKRQAMRVTMTPKLSKQQRTRDARMQAIQQNLDDMPKRLEAHRKEVRARKPAKGIAALLAKSQGPSHGGS